MGPLHVLIVDDEPLARMRLRSLLQEAVAGEGGQAPAAVEAGDADQALALVRAQRFDALLLDIRMPGRDGLRLAAALRRLPEPPAVVFVTAHAEHALRAFELDAVDYLTKPVRRERLEEALRRVRERRGTAARSALPPAPGGAAARPPLVVTARGRVLRLPLSELVYLKAGQKYVTVRTAGEAYLIDESLVDLEPRLGPGFIRIHRNAIVARDSIRALALRDSLDEEAPGEGWAVRVAPTDEWLAVSRRQVAAVRQALGAEPA